MAVSSADLESKRQSVAVAVRDLRAPFPFPKPESTREQGVRQMAHLMEDIQEAASQGLKFVGVIPQYHSPVNLAGSSAPVSTANRNEDARDAKNARGDHASLENEKLGAGDVCAAPAGRNQSPEPSSGPRGEVPITEQPSLPSGEGDGGELSPQRVSKTLDGLDSDPLEAHEEPLSGRPPKAVPSAHDLSSLQSPPSLGCPAKYDTHLFLPVQLMTSCLFLPQLTLGVPDFQPGCKLFLLSRPEVSWDSRDSQSPAYPRDGASLGPHLQANCSLPSMPESLHPGTDLRAGHLPLCSHSLVAWQGLNGPGPQAGRTQPPHPWAPCPLGLPSLSPLVGLGQLSEHECNRRDQNETRYLLLEAATASPCPAARRQARLSCWVAVAPETSTKPDEGDFSHS
ncbi:hypothetical protein P7K49_031544 [Saguinus oedipus]|uniref:Uncharacterized protein n=1 Tax=Saguinus oedipus TaxID=9490 RepID=A0ABQ9TZP7_SAGOE|nr:hypothetical protein P7K49_031544 [Saguinus oedipus]